MRALRLVARGARFLTAALDHTIFPRHCLLSGQPLTEPAPLPLISQAALDACEPAPSDLELMLTAQRHHEADDLYLSSIQALYAVGPPLGIQEAIHAIKYRGHRTLAVALGAHLAVLLEAPQPMPEAIVPVPIHPARHRERGYNQSVLLARGLSSVTGIPVMDVLRRVVNTRSQTTLSDAQRSRNVHDVFALDPRADVRERRLLIIDDVFTTGATMNACAEVLLGEGAVRVDALAVGATV